MTSPRVRSSTCPIFLLLSFAVKGDPAATSGLVRLGEDVVLVTGGISQIGYRNHGKNGGVHGIADLNRHINAFQPLDPIRTPVDVWARSFQNMVIDVNPGVEVIIHSWNPDVALTFSKYLAPVRGVYEVNSVYKTKFKAVLNNSKTSSISQISRAFSFMQAGRLMLEREAERGQKFKRAVFLRSDLLMLTPFRIRDMVADPAVVYVSAVCGNNSDSFYAMTRDAAVTFSGIYNAISENFPARVNINGMRQCSDSNRHWMTRFIEENMNMVMGMSDSFLHLIYRFVNYKSILQNSDLLKSWKYPPECALEIAKVTAWGDHRKAKYMTKLESDAFYAFHNGDNKRRAKFISKVLQFWAGNASKSEEGRSPTSQGGDIWPPTPTPSVPPTTLPTPTAPSTVWWEITSAMAGIMVAAAMGFALFKGVFATKPVRLADAANELLVPIPIGSGPL